MTTILQQLAAGDKTAVARCLDAYGGMVWSLAHRYLSAQFSESSVEVEDGVQEVFVSVWLAAPSFNPALGSEPAFVATIAHRRLIDYRRRLQTRRVHESAVVADSVRPPQAPGEEELNRLGSEFRKLPDEERTALWLAVVRGLSHREISEATTAPIGTVKTRLRKAVLRLQDAWATERLAMGTEVKS